MCGCWWIEARRWQAIRWKLVANNCACPLLACDDGRRVGCAFPANADCLPRRIYPLLTSVRPSSAAQRECFIARDTGGIGGQANTHSNHDQPHIPCAANAPMYGRNPPSASESHWTDTPRLAANWEDASKRVLSSYRDWLRAVRIP